MVLERTGVDYHAKGRAWFERLLRAIAERPSEGSEQSGQPDAGLLERIGRLGATLAGSRLLTTAVVSGLAAGEPDEILAAMAKLHSSEAAAAVAELATAEVGTAQGWVDAAYREAPGLTLSAGSSEMMLKLIAGGRLGAAAPAPGTAG
jgi:alkylation response protein AidB-like acyl-CoA dehydrogenase